MKLFSNKKVGLVYSSYYEVDEKLNLKRTINAEYRGYVLNEYAITGSKAIVVGGESNAVIRKECFEKIGLFDENLEQTTGWDLYRRIASFYEFDYIKKPLMKYRIHGTNIHMNKNMIFQIESAVKKMFDDPISSKYYT